MHSPALVLSAALLACAPTIPAAAPETPARAGPYSVQLVDEAGRPLPAFDHRGRTYVLGELGQRYLLRIRNDSPRRVEVVASVDGRDVIDGRPANPEKRGYLVEPWSEVTIDGFRLSASAVAAFRFSTVARSYAARMGDARDVGVIGLAVFPEVERVARPLPFPRPRARSAWPDPAARDEAAPSPASGEAQASGPAPSRAQKSKAGAGAARRPGLGTEFGEDQASPVQQVAFERASRSPAAVLALRYDDRRGLAALGIDVER